MTELKTVQALVRSLELLADVYDAMGAPRGPARIMADPAIADGKALIEQMQREAVQPPEGWRLVPVEPTEEMWKAADLIDDRMFAGGSSHGAETGQIWEAMLYAAPQPAQASDRVEQIQPVHSTRASGVCASTTPLDITLTRDETAFTASFLIDEDQEPGDDAVQPVAWRVRRSGDEQYELFFNREMAQRRAECFVPPRKAEPLYAAPHPAQASPRKRGRRAAND